MQATETEASRYMTRSISHYELHVSRGRLAGTVRRYEYANRTRARRFADRLDMEYGAICCSVRPVFVA